MRFVIILSCLFLLFSTTYGQTYVPLNAGSASWNTRLWFLWPGGESIRTEGFHVYTDTLIDGNTYQNLLAYDVTTGLIDGLVGAIREDSLRNVWFRSNNSVFECSAAANDSTDILLWSFNDHGVGDSIEIVNYQGWGTRFAVVQTIDSIMVGGNYRLKYDVTYVGTGTPNLPDYWISGIGPSKGLLSAHLDLLECLPDLSCYEDTTVNWLNPIMDSCNYNFVGIEEYLRSLVSIYPNPVRSKFTIQSDIQFSGYKLYSLSGALIQSKQERVSTVSLEKVKTGMYVLELVSEKYTIRKKLMVE
jgi:hypothetical protein